MIKPICRILIMLKNTEDFATLNEDLTRAFTHIAPVKVLLDQPSNRPVDPENIFTLIVKLYKPYWLSSEEEADSVWNDVLIPWLTNKLQFLEQNIAYYNQNTSRHKSIPIHFDHLALQMDSTTIYFANPQKDDFVAVLPLLQSFRDKLNNGILKGLSVERVEFPWPGALKKPDTKNDVLVEQNPAVLLAQESIPDPGDSNPAELGSAEPSPEVLPEPEPEVTTIDYTVWEITTSEGMVRLLDSSEDLWLDSNSLSYTSLD